MMGGLHVLSRPEELAPHADALALGEGVQLWPRILNDVAAGRLEPRYVGSFGEAYELEVRRAPARRAAAPGFSTTSSLIATRGCHNRCGFCYLSTDRLRMPYQMKTALSIVEEFEANDEPYGVFIDNNLGSRRDYLQTLCRASRNCEKIWSAAVSIDVTDDPSLVREMAGSGRLHGRICGL